MPINIEPHPTTDWPVVADVVVPLVVDAKGLALMIHRSHRTVMVLAAAEAWRLGRLPVPTYIGESVRTRKGPGRRWLITTVEAWLATQPGTTEVTS